jgi:hypothetical protein
MDEMARREMAIEIGYRWLPLKLVDFEANVLHDIGQSNGDTGDIDDVKHLS